MSRERFHGMLSQEQTDQLADKLKETNAVRVCGACGTPACLAGDWVCDQAKLAGIDWCTCDWGDGTNELVPKAIDPECEVHGPGDHIWVGP